MSNKVTKVIEILIVLLVGVIFVLGSMYIKDDKLDKEEVIKSNVNILETDSINEAVNKVYDSVVLIESYTKGQLISTGTGFVYKKDKNIGYILTNQHVIEDSDEVRIVYIDGSKADAKLLGSDVLSDIAVLSVNKESVLAVSTLGESKESNIGDTIFTVGSPLGESYMGTVTKGIVSGLNRNITVQTSNGNYIMDVLQIDAAINPGNSGGPLVNLKGEVIGINSIKLVQDKVEGMGFAIPIELVLTMTDNLEKGKKIERPIFGVTSTVVYDNYNLRNAGIVLDKNIEEGVVILTVEPNSSAGNSGILKGDVIYEIEGEDVEDLASFRYELYKHNVGDTIEVKLIRNGSKETVKVELIK